MHTFLSLFFSLSLSLYTYADIRIRLIKRLDDRRKQYIHRIIPSFAFVMLFLIRLRGVMVRHNISLKKVRLTLKSHLLLQYHLITYLII